LIPDAVLTINNLITCCWRWGWCRAGITRPSTVVHHIFIVVAILLPMFTVIIIIWTQQWIWWRCWYLCCWKQTNNIYKTDCFTYGSLLYFSLSNHSLQIVL